MSITAEFLKLKESKIRALKYENEILGYRLYAYDIKERKLNIIDFSVEDLDVLTEEQRSYILGCLEDVAKFEVLQLQMFKGILITNEELENRVIVTEEFDLDVIYSYMQIIKKVMF